MAQGFLGIDVGGHVYGKDVYSTKPYPLKNATIEAVCVEDTTVSGSTLSKDDGSFNLMLNTSKPFSKKRHLRLTVSYVGMGDADTVATKIWYAMPGYLQRTVIDSIVLESKPITLEEAQIMGELKKVYLKGDTTVFNVAAYKMPEGSVLLELVRRLPGLHYADGRLTYMGRSIDEMRLNGDTFFKHDIKIALENMPNSALKTVKVYEADKDTTNVLAGGHLVMDMETKEKVSNVKFANLSAGTYYKGWGYDLDGSGDLYVKKGPQITLHGSAKNTPDKYIPKTENINKYLSASFSQNFDHLRFYPVYAHNYFKDGTSSNSLTRQYLADNTLENRNATRNSERRVLDDVNIYTLNFTQGKTSFSLERGNISRRHTSGRSESETSSYVGGNQTYNSRQVTNTDRTDREVNLSGDLSSRLKSATYGVRMDFGYGKGDGSELRRETNVFTNAGDSISAFTRSNAVSSKSNSWSAEPYFRLNFGRRNSWEIAINYSHRNSDKDNLYDNIDGNTVTHLDSMSYRQDEKTISRGISSQISLSTSSTSRLDASASLTSAKAALGYYREDGLSQPISRKSTLWRYRLGYTKSFGRVRINGALNAQKSMAPLSQMLSVANYTDPLNTTSGNSSLKDFKTYMMNAGLKFGTAFSISEEVSFTDDAITSRMTYDPRTGVRSTSLTNVNGNYNLKTTANYNHALGDFTLGTRGTIEKRHSVMFSQKSIDESASKGAADYYTANISERCSYSSSFMTQTLDCSYLYNRSKSSFGRSNRLAYTFRLDSHFYLPWHMELGSDINWQSNHGTGISGRSKDIVAWNLSMACKVFKKKTGEIKLSAYDVLNKRQEISNDFSDNIWSERSSEGDTRYILLTFSYRLSSL